MGQFVIEWIEDHAMGLLIGVVIAIVLIVIIVSFYDERDWLRFKTAHNCVEFGTRRGSPTYYKSGDMLIPIENEEHGFKCDDGKEYWRK